MQKITPFLWFDTQAEEAANFYVSVFRNSRIVSVMRAGDRVLGVSFELDGCAVQALNGGPTYKLTPAFSMFVSCETQKEVDEYWGKLTAGGAESQCGWLVDKFGLSWQVVPTVLPKLLQDEDPGRAGRAMQAMLKMKKIDIAKLEQAARGRSA